jgi:threonine/homoserine/homoserine lactone efflux protein
MLTLTTILASSFVIALSGAAMPGPLLSATISESVRRGMISGPILIIGHSLLELALVILLMFGLAPFLKQEWVFAAIAIIGSIMLAWMGLGMLRAMPTLSIRTDVQTMGGPHLVFTGILLSLANPYWVLWWATIGLAYILYCARYGAWGVVFFFIGHILGDLAWYGAVSFAVGKGRRFLSDNHYRALIGTCAVFLLLLSCYFAWSGLNKALSL